MRPLTIALCLHGYFPDQFFGTAVYARQLAEALQRRGNRVVIVVPRFDASLDHPRLSEPEWLGGIEIRRILRPRMRGMRDTFDDPRLMPQLRETFSAIGADIVHLAHFLGLGTALFAAAKSLNLPIFATLTDFHGFCQRGTLLNSWGLSLQGPQPLAHQLRVLRLARLCRRAAKFMDTGLSRVLVRAPDERDRPPPSDGGSSPTVGRRHSRASPAPRPAVR